MVDRRRRSSGPCHKLNLGCGEERKEGGEVGGEGGEGGGEEGRREGRKGNEENSASGMKLLSCLCTVVLVIFATQVKKRNLKFMLFRLLVVRLLVLS